MQEKLIKLIKERKFAAAETLLKAQLQTSPNDCWLLTQLANVLWNRHKDEEALHFADMAKGVAPANPLLNYTRGRILWSLEKYEQSIAEWDIILNMSETDIAGNGYGTRWAKGILRKSQAYILKIKSTQENCQ